MEVSSTYPSVHTIPHHDRMMEETNVGKGQLVHHHHPNHDLLNNIDIYQKSTFRLNFCLNFHLIFLIVMFTSVWLPVPAHLRSLPALAACFTGNITAGHGVPHIQRRVVLDFCTQILCARQTQVQTFGRLPRCPRLFLSLAPFLPRLLFFILENTRSLARTFPPRPVPPLHISHRPRWLASAWMSTARSPRSSSSRWSTLSSTTSTGKFCPGCGPTTSAL